jgi:hypothetical protein
MEIGEELDISIKDFFDLVNKEGGEYEIETPEGFVKIEEYLIKFKECLQIELDNDMFLECSKDHLLSTDSKHGFLKDDGYWIYAGDCKNGIPILTINGYYKIKSIKETGSHTVYDFTIGCDKHYYYSNGIVSHNTGKTGLVDELFVLNVFNWWRNNNFDSNIKISWIYNSMERNRDLKIAKWIALLLYKDTGNLISTATLIGATKNSKDEKLVKENEIKNLYKEKIESYRDYFIEFEKHAIIFDGALTPKKIYNNCIKFAKKHGRIIDNEYGFDYEPNHPDHYVFVINDHVGKIKGGIGESAKSIIDEHSEYMGLLRDKFNFIPVDIYQFNRSLADSQRKKNDDMYPRLEDFKGSSNGTENSDIVLALFNPFRYNLENHLGYDVNFFMNKLRTLSVLKNSYGEDDVEYAFGFIGEVGSFVELPNPDKLILHLEREKIQKLLNL